MEPFYQEEVRKRSDNMLKLEFTREEIKTIKEKIYLTEVQEKILDMKLKGDLTEIGMAMELGLNRIALYYRIKRGWSIEKALITPLKINNNKCLKNSGL